MTYLKSIILPQLSDSKAWLDFVTALENVLSSPDSFHYCNTLQFDLLKTIFEVSVNSGLAPNSIQFQTDSFIFLNKSISSPALVLRQALLSNFSDFRIDYKYRSNFEVISGINTQTVGEAVTLTEQITAEPYYYFTTTVKEIVSEVHFLTYVTYNPEAPPDEQHTTHEVKVLGVSKELLKLSEVLPLGTYDLLKTENKLLTQPNQLQLLSLLDYLSDSQEETIADFLRRTRPLRCEVTGFLADNIEELDTLRVVSTLSLNYQGFSSVESLLSINLSSTPGDFSFYQSPVEIPFYRQGSVVIYKRFLNGKHSNIFIDATISGDQIIKGPNVFEIFSETSLLNSKKDFESITLIMGKTNGGHVGDGVGTGQITNIPCVAELLGNDQRRLYSFTISVGAYNPSIVTRDVGELLPPIYEEFS